MCIRDSYMPKAGEVNKFRTDIILADKESKEQASNKLRFIYLALPLFKKEPAAVSYTHLDVYKRQR